LSDLVWTAWRPGLTYNGGGFEMHNPPKYKRHVVGFWPLSVSRIQLVSLPPPSPIHIPLELGDHFQRMHPKALCGTTSVGTEFEVKPLPVTEATCKVCQQTWRAKGLFARQALACTRHLRDDPAAASFRDQIGDNTTNSILAFADWLEERADPTAKFLRVIAMVDLDWQSAIRPAVEVKQ